MPVEFSESFSPIFKVTDAGREVLKKTAEAHVMTTVAAPALIIRSAEILLRTFTDIKNNNPEISNISNKEILSKSWEEHKIMAKNTLSGTTFAKIYKSSATVLSNISQSKAFNINVEMFNRSSSEASKKTSENPSVYASAIDSQEIADKFENLVEDFFANRHDVEALKTIKNKQSELLNHKIDKKLEKELTLRQKTAENILKTFPSSDYKGSLQETVAHLCEKQNLTKSDIIKEARLLGDLRGDGGKVSEEVAMMKMVNRLAIYKQSQLNEGQNPSLAKRQEATGYEPSVIKGIEKLFKQHVRGEVDSTPKKIGKVMAIPTEKGVFIEEKFAAEGSNKLVVFATNYFKVKTPDDRKQYVTLKLKEENIATLKPSPDTTLKGNSLAKVPFSEEIDVLSEEESIDIGTSVIIHAEDENADAETSVIIHDAEGENSGSENSVIIHDEDENFGSETSVIIHDEDENIGSETSVIIHDVEDENIDTGTRVITNQENKTAINTAFFRGNSPQPLSQERLSWDKISIKDTSIDNLKKLLVEIEKELKTPNISKAEQSDLLEKQEEIKKYLTIREKDKNILDKYEDPSEIELYLEEIELTKQLQGEGVVKIHSIVDLNSGNKIMVQEAAGYKLSNGKIAASLEQMSELQIDNELTPQEEIKFTKIILDAFKGIARLHDEGYILRDLKEENILVTKDGRGVLADFGTVVKKRRRSKQMCLCRKPSL